MGDGNNTVGQASRLSPFSWDAPVIGAVAGITVNRLSGGSLNGNRRDGRTSTWHLSYGRPLDIHGRCHDVAPRVTGHRYIISVNAFVLAALLVLSPHRALADLGYYNVVQLAFTNAVHPSINNSNEIVWAGQNTGGIYSSTRGKLSATGQLPHLANSGEVVYADSFGGSGMDLVSTSRGRLTTNGIIDVGFSDFDINASGEVVYVALDSNSLHQVYSTVRGQITFDLVDHYNPCINDLGEILWNRYGAGPGLVSSTRGPLPGYYPTIYVVNNFDEFCYQGNLYSGPISTAPHLFSSLHGVVINDAYQYQFYGGINDAGTLVWNAQGVAPPTMYIFEATWVPSPSVSLVRQLPGFALEWPTNPGAYHAQYSTNLASTNWLRLGGSLSTNSGIIYQTIPANIGSAAFFRLSNGNP